MDEAMEQKFPPSPARPQKQRLKGEQGRNPYDGLRPWSAATHGVGIALGLWGTILLLLRAVQLGGGLRIAVCAIYGLSMVGLYTASTLYHTLRTSERGRMNLRRYDHASIYVLIAGSYTPICLLGLEGPLGWALFGVIWSLAVAGLVLSIVWIMAPRWLTAGIYLFMGWLAIFAIYPLSRSLPVEGMALLLGGGLLYTVGGVLYALKWPGRSNPHFGCHEIFHVFILLGSIVHFFMMYQVVVYL